MNILGAILLVIALAGCTQNIFSRDGGGEDFGTLAQQVGKQLGH